MRLVFWQNCLSPHQLPYIVHLLDDPRIDEVVVAVGEAISDGRVKMGWVTVSYPGIEKCDLRVNPSADEIDQLLRKDVTSSVHLFSGIRGYAFVFNAFRLSLDVKGLRRSLVMERPNTYAFGRANGKPLWLHWLKWKFIDARNVRYIESVFAMGESARKFYQSLNKNWQVYPFGYCTYNPCAISTASAPATTNCPQMAFVGNLSWWKSVDKLLISTTIALKFGCILTLDIIGDGVERKRLMEYKEREQLDNVKFLGKIQQNEIPHWLSSYDVLILPSIYDGWGAVVNEGLQQGLYVICSDKCGASDLLKDERCGAVFSAGNVNDLAEKIKYVCHHIDKIRQSRIWRRQWADRCISGEAMAAYMIDRLSGVERATPWGIAE